MNRIAKVLSQISDDMLMHYGVARRSGRYPWGSGDNPYQHSGDFLSRVQSLKKSGMSETDIAKTMGLTTTQLRTQMSLAKDERRAVQVATAKDLREKQGVFLDGVRQCPEQGGRGKPEDLCHHGRNEVWYGPAVLCTHPPQALL